MRFLLVVLIAVIVLAGCSATQRGRFWSCLSRSPHLVTDLGQSGFRGWFTFRGEMVSHGCHALVNVP